MSFLYLAFVRHGWRPHQRTGHKSAVWHMLGWLKYFSPESVCSESFALPTRLASTVWRGFG